MVTRIDGSNPTVMSNLGEAQMPSWSPDGRSVLYEDSNNDYRLTTLATGRSRVLSPDGTDFGAALAPDGRTIAYTHGTVPGFLDDYVLKSSLRVRTADGYVTHLPVDALGPGTPSWSPDGSKLAFAGRMVSTQSAETGLD